MDINNEVEVNEVPSFCQDCTSRNCGSCEWTLGNLPPDED